MSFTLDRLALFPKMDQACNARWASSRISDLYEEKRGWALSVTSKHDAQAEKLRTLRHTSQIMYTLVSSSFGLHEAGTINAM